MQAQRDAMGAVRVNDTLRRQATWDCIGCRINLSVQCNGFAGTLTTDLRAIAIEQSQVGGV